jgi:CRP-like cAMP-binding protein
MNGFENLKLFVDISKEEIQRILSCSKSGVKTYTEGSYIFMQGEKPEKLFLLLEGEIQICKDFSSGKRSVLYMIEPGNVFGEIFLFGDKKQYWYGAVATVKVQVLEIPWEFFYHFCSNACDHHKQLTRNMLEILSENNFKITRKLQIVSTSSLRERLAIWLMDAMDDKGVVRLTMNREQLADFLGVARPSLSRELMRMQKEGLLTVDKKQITVCDKEAVENLYG